MHEEQAWSKHMVGVYLVHAAYWRLHFILASRQTSNQVELGQ